MTDPVLLQEVKRFIQTHPLGTGVHTVQGKRIVKEVRAGVEHRLAFAGAANPKVWMPFSWTLSGLGDVTITALTFRPDLVVTADQTPDEDDLASLAVWLLAANR